jgi:16S rRNA (cytosine967-C5)-methyltransferase
VRSLLGARPTAARVLDRILRGGAYSNVLLAATATEPSSDHAHFQRLVFTALRHLPVIDATLTSASNRPLGSVDPLVLAVLRVASAELLVLGTDAHAAVNEAVDSSRILRRGHAAGFVNGVLRDVSTRRPVTDGLEDAFPEPFLSMLRDSLGSESALGRSWCDQFLRASNGPARVGLRFRDGRFPDAPIPNTAYGPAGESGRNAVDDPVVQVIDPASSAAALAVGAGEGDRVADLAAAPGGKSLVLADAVGHGGSVIAVDIHPRRVRDASRRTAVRTGSKGGPIRWVVADAAASPLRPSTLDHVLLDAPCTGLGTLRRRPEIRFRVSGDAPDRYGRLQRTLVEKTLPLVRPGGRFVYSVCTVTSQETAAVVRGLGFHPPEGLPGRIVGDGLLLSPNDTNTDGMFIAVSDR